MTLKLTNTLTRKKQEFEPIKEGKIGIYSCGPTVYWYQHIGHMYSYVQWDCMVRLFRYLGNEVTWVVNITDVGHMTGENEGNPDAGEDKMEKGAKREGISVWELADKYIDQFKESLTLLNIRTPDKLPRATKHIDEQIELAKKIEKNGYTYQTNTGLVYDTSKFKDYSSFANLDLKKQIKRKDVEDDPEKKKPWDFFLWVTGNPDHIMKWDSPWGEGYPGWHIECTAMSVKYLGKAFDIHTGGVEHIPVHHTNEIAQGVGAFGNQTANYWIHNSWLTFKGEKMSKSLGNIYTIQQLVEKGYDPMHFRYLVLTSHYRKGLNFSFEALDSAKNAYERLVNLLVSWREHGRESLSDEKLDKLKEFKEQFVAKVSNDLNFPEGIGVIWKIAKSNIPNIDKYDLVIELDQILGLNLREKVEEREVPEKVKKLVERREKLRDEGEFNEADKLRKEIEEMGFTVDDTKDGSIVKPQK